MSSTEVIFEVLVIHQNLRDNLLAATGGKERAYKDVRADHQVTTAMMVRRAASAIDATGKLYTQSADELVEGALELCGEEAARVMYGAPVLIMLLYSAQLIICRVCDARV